MLAEVFTGKCPFYCKHDQSTEEKNKCSQTLRKQLLFGYLEIWKLHNTGWDWHAAERDTTWVRCRWMDTADETWRPDSTWSVINLQTAMTTIYLFIISLSYCHCQNWCYIKTKQFVIWLSKIRDRDWSYTRHVICTNNHFWPVGRGSGQKYRCASIIYSALRNVDIVSCDVTVISSLIRFTSRFLLPFVYLKEF